MDQSQPQNFTHYPIPPPLLESVRETGGTLVCAVLLCSPFSVLFFFFNCSTSFLKLLLQLPSSQLLLLLCLRCKWQIRQCCSHPLPTPHPSVPNLLRSSSFSSSPGALLAVVCALSLAPLPVSGPSRSNLWVVRALSFHLHSATWSPCPMCHGSMAPCTMHSSYSFTPFGKSCSTNTNYTVTQIPATVRLGQQII